MPPKSNADSEVPFIDNILHVGRLGVKYVAAPMGSQNDSAVATACEDLGITRKQFFLYRTPLIPLSAALL